MLKDKSWFRVLGIALGACLVISAFLVTVTLAANCAQVVDCCHASKYWTENEGTNVSGWENTGGACVEDAWVTSGLLNDAYIGDWECEPTGETGNLNAILCDSLCTAPQGETRPASRKSFISTIKAGASVAQCTEQTYP